ncbi:MAG: hypothetical protein ACM3S1_15415 [Hyphomicrobiales bacterium]
MFRRSFPTRRLPWLLLAVSCAALAWGLLASSSGLVTLGAIGIALTLIAFVIAPRMVGGAPPDAEQLAPRPGARPGDGRPGGHRD